MVPQSDLVSDALSPRANSITDGPNPPPPPQSGERPRLGGKLFPSTWTGEEHKARRGLISKDEWSRIKDPPPARGGGPPRSEILRSRRASAADQTPHASDDPSDPLYRLKVADPPNSPNLVAMVGPRIPAKRLWAVRERWRQAAQGIFR
jgi:hypothetical protein